MRLYLSRKSFHSLNCGLCVMVLVMVLGLITYNHMFQVYSMLTSKSSDRILNYTIVPGDTLWTLASKTTSRSEDVRKQLTQIQKLNRLDINQPLQPGTLIVIPVKYREVDPLQFTQVTSHRSQGQQESY